MFEPMYTRPFTRNIENSLFHPVLFIPVFYHFCMRFLRINFLYDLSSKVTYIHAPHLPFFHFATDVGIALISPSFIVDHLLVALLNYIPW